MQKSPIDEMTEFAIEALLSGSDARRRALVRDLCHRWPNEPGLAVVFVLTNAASLIEDNFDRARDDSRIGPFAYKLAAVLAADVFAVQAMGQSPVKAHDLLHFWRRVDSYFLDL